jgi:hypothetical protein
MTDWTETELAALRRAYASGTTRVSYAGKSVDYGSAEDLLGRIQKIGLNQRAILLVYCLQDRFMHID